MKRILPTAALGISILATASAFAADGYVTGNVNLRAGPDSDYPSVVMLSAGTPVAINGCVDRWSWCDVSAQDNRGWIAGNFLQEEYQGQRVLISDYGVRIGVPIVSFVFGTYWDEHYRHRPWYGQRRHWSQVRPRYEFFSGRGDSSHGNSHERHGDSRDTHHGDAHNSNTPTNHAVPATTSQTYRSKSAVKTTTPPPVAPKNMRVPQAQSNHAVHQISHRAAAPKAVDEQRVVHSRKVTTHPTVAPKPVLKSPPAKAPPVKKDKKDKDKDKNNSGGG